DAGRGGWGLRRGMRAAVELILRTQPNVWKLPLAARGVAPDPVRQDETARAKLARWDDRPDRADWQVVWARDGDGPPRPLFLRLEGKTAGGETGIHDGQYVEVVGWDPDEPPPKADRPPQVLIATPPEKSEKGIKLF